MNPAVAKQLEDLVNGIDFSDFPYQKGNSIRIGHMVVRKSKHGYLVYDITQNKKIAQTYSKTAAIALARDCVKGRDRFTSIEELDQLLAKHHIDSLFYKNTIENTDNNVKRETAEFRLDIALDKTYQAKAKLMRFIFE